MAMATTRSRYVFIYGFLATTAAAARRRRRRRAGFAPCFADVVGGVRPRPLPHPSVAAAAVLLLVASASPSSSFPPPSGASSTVPSAAAARPAASSASRSPPPPPPRPRDGAVGSSSASYRASTTRTAAATVSNGDGEVAAPTSPAATARRRYWRIARELGRNVWPTVPPRVPRWKADDDARRDFQPIDAPADAARREERRAALGVRYRVIASLALMLAGKGVTIATPFLFKMLVDAVPGADAASTSSASLPDFVSNLPLSLPVLLLLSYGLCRSLASLLRESTNAAFAGVAQSAIRRFGRSTFDHVHSLDLQYHLDRNTITSTATPGRCLGCWNAGVGASLSH
ncbi:hypothetical protein ACHAWF_011268 [Thalassiosira exigua]